MGTGSVLVLVNTTVQVKSPPGSVRLPEVGECVGDGGGGAVRRLVRCAALVRFRCGDGVGEGGAAGAGEGGGEGAGVAGPGGEHGAHRRGARAPGGQVAVDVVGEGGDGD